MEQACCPLDFIEANSWSTAVFVALPYSPYLFKQDERAGNLCGDAVLFVNFKAR